MKEEATPHPILGALVVTLPLWAAGLHLVSGHIFTGQWNSPHLHRCVRSSRELRDSEGHPLLCVRSHTRGRRASRLSRANEQGAPQKGKETKVHQSLSKPGDPEETKTESLPTRSSCFREGDKQLEPITAGRAKGTWSCQHPE